MLIAPARAHRSCDVYARPPASNLASLLTSIYLLLSSHYSEPQIYLNDVVCLDIGGAGGQESIGGLGGDLSLAIDGMIKPKLMYTSEFFTSLVCCEY